VLRRKQEEESAVTTPVVDTGADRVTGLPGRNQLAPWLQENLDKGRASSERTALIFIDIGHLRDVNDTYGPDVGDELLREIATRLGAEIGGGQRLLRYAGAEFALIAPGIQTMETIASLAEGIFELMADPFTIAGNPIAVSCSVGAALSDQGYGNIRGWIDDAHDALGEAREMGHKAIVTRDEASRNRIDIRITEDRIHKAVENNEFRLLYQPIVTTQNGRVVGFEALLRWLDPGASAKFVPPAQFLPLLEKTGRIIEVGEWVLNEATAQITSWNQRFPDREPFFVTVNLGARQIAQTRFSDTVAKALDNAGMRPELLTLDITPEALKFNKQAIWSELRDLKMLGVRIALDDFGLGESTVGYLRDINVDLLRIHRTFINGLGTTPEDDAITKHLIGLGLDLGILSLAEGVETAAQAKRLIELNCGLAQGFHFGRPETPEDIEARME
jgi:diguanylate cyclase (GGDEF)-like protein